MPALLHKLNYTYGEYLGFEASSNVKHEFLDGQIYAMAGGTPEYAALAAAAITLLGPQLRGSECRPYNSDLRVRTPTGLTRSRGEDGWRKTVVHEGAIAELSIGVRLDVRELYDAAAEPSA